MGVRANDIFIKVNGTEVSLQNARMVIGTLSQQPIGYEYDLTVLRGDEEKEIKVKIIAKEEVKEHMFTIDEDASAEAKRLRAIWQKNI
ncbi:hypothetical protein C9994_15265 [Marivirga lumbricoides]|uniref:PDZ domain-containing protein n=1 Tax=Marivirga lumbricoides TaxID=1046115 RepID=A0A2T4DD02_9BACT|nr:hypothetical protein C9994_15265 [Marivirga lumbricoides]